MTRTQAWLYAAGYVVLLAGSLGSAWAYKVGAKEDARAAVEAEAFDSKIYSYKLEQTAGNANVLGFEMRQWFDGLWHGTELAYTLAAFSFATALACFFVAIYLPSFPRFDDPGERPGVPPR
jgi:hypothetical protein